MYICIHCLKLTVAEVSAEVRGQLGNHEVEEQVKFQRLGQKHWPSIGQYFPKTTPNPFKSRQKELLHAQFFFCRISFSFFLEVFFYQLWTSNRLIKSTKFMPFSNCIFRIILAKESSFQTTCFHLNYRCFIFSSAHFRLLVVEKTWTPHDAAHLLLGWCSPNTTFLNIFPKKLRLNSMRWGVSCFQSPNQFSHKSALFCCQT